MSTRLASEHAARIAIDVAERETGHDDEFAAQLAAAYVRGYAEGHEQGGAEGSTIAATIQQILAEAWDAGHDAGHRDGAAAERQDIAQAIADLAVSSAEIDAAWRHFGRATREQRIAAETAQMERHAAELHERIGTTEWVGMDNGAQRPPADWEPSPAHLADVADKADRARALAPEPVLTAWAQVRTYAGDRTWHRILRDLHPDRQRKAAINQANRTNRNEAA